MSLFLKQGFTSGNLHLCQPRRSSLFIDFLVEPKRVNCPAHLQFRPFSASRQCRPRALNPKYGIHLTKGARHQHRNSYEKTYFQDPEASRWQPPQGASGTVVLYSIVGSCIGIFLYNGQLQLEASKKVSKEAVRKANDFLQHFVMSARSLEPGRYYTLVSSAFMHRDFMHLAFCMLGLYSFGRTTIMMTGIPSFMILYFGSAIAGGVAQVKFWERTRSPYTTNYGMGSSGAISGLFAAMACVAPSSRILLFFVPMPIIAGAALEVIISIGGMQGRWLQGWGHADHLGGMAFGAVWGLLAMRRGAPLGRLFRPRY